MIYRTCRGLSPVIPVIMLMLAFPCAGADVYGGTKPADYVSGKFDPSKHSLFVECASLGIPAGKGIYLRRETAKAFAAMIRDFRKTNPAIAVTVLSGTRDWDTQRTIWENKFTGRTPVAGKDLSRTISDERARALQILRYSSMPGTSRHHWGSDVDINALNNEYFSSGSGKVLYSWLVKNARRYGFAQPYTAGRKDGYEEERWHWSYLPLAAQFQKQWNASFKRDPALVLSRGTFAGAAAIIDRAPVYVNTVNPECLRAPRAIAFD